MKEVRRNRNPKPSPPSRVSPPILRPPTSPTPPSLPFLKTTLISNSPQLFPNCSCPDCSQISNPSFIAKNHRMYSKLLCRCSNNDASTSSTAAAVPISGNSSSDWNWNCWNRHFPQIEQAERRVSLIKNVVIPSSFQGLRVMLVDHDINSQAHIASLLEQQSYQVTTTERATAALSMIQDGGQYELILADVNTVEMDCFKFIKEMSQYNLSIVVMAATEDMNKAEKVVRECKVSFLGKPFGAKSILNVWQHVHRMRRTVPVKETTDISTVEDNSSQQNSNGVARGIVKPTEGEEGVKVKKKRHLSSRMTWTPALRLRFTQAFHALGEQKAHPKALLRKMDVPFLTQRHIASHLQKYKARIKRQSKNSTYDQSFMTKSIINSSVAYGSTTQPTMLISTTPRTMPGLNASGATYLTLETLKDQLKIGAEIPTRNTTPQTFNHGDVWGPNMGNEKLPVALETGTKNAVPGMILSELNYPSNNLQNLLNSSTPNVDVTRCLESSNHLEMLIPSQMEETNYSREFEEGGSNQIEGMEGATSSLNDEQGMSQVLDMISKQLEDEDVENSGEITEDDIDRFLQYLWPPSDFE